MAKIKEQFRIIPAHEIKYITENGTECVLRNKLTNKGIVVLKIKPGRVPELLEFLQKFVKRPDWRKRLLDITIEIFYKTRTLNQNSLYWALVNILCFIAYGHYGYEEEIHEGLLQIYGVREEEKATGALIAKRSKKMTTVEFAELIQGAFHEIASQGVPVNTAPDIKRYWEEFYKIRWKDGADVLTFKSLEDYRSRVNYCEACMTYLDYNETAHRYEDTPGNLCHIVSKGTGGDDDQENLLHLCDTCHVGEQHEAGWNVFLEKHPHLAPKVKRARERAGKKPLLQEDLKLSLPEPEAPDQDETEQLEIF